MTEKLEITEKRFDEINEKLTDINVITIRSSIRV